MTLNDLINNWNDISNTLKVQALNQVIAEGLARLEEGDDSLFNSFLTQAAVYEDEDYFGTEGLNIGD